MKFSLRTVIVLVAFVSLAVAVVASNWRAYLAESEFGRGDSFVFNIGTAVELQGSAEEKQVAMDRIQGAAYRILCQDRYDPIFNAISPQIRLRFSQMEGDKYELDCMPIGHVKKSDEYLVEQYRQELYDFLYDFCQRRESTDSAKLGG